MDKLYVNVKVTVSDTERFWYSKAGKAEQEMDFSFPASANDQVMAAAITDTVSRALKLSLAELRAELALAEAEYAAEKPQAVAK